MWTKAEKSASKNILNRLQERVKELDYPPAPTNALFELERLFLTLGLIEKGE